MRYPLTPEGWTVSARSSVGPFSTHFTWRHAGGGVTEWSSRAHRKRTSRLAGHAAGVWWAPWRVSWWIGVLFAFGSTCFFVGPFPGFVELVGSQVDGIVFFVGSIFFTSAAAFGISAIAAFWVPSSGSVVDLAVANVFTAFGGLCFLVGAILLLPESAGHARAAAGA